MGWFCARAGCAARGARLDPTHATCPSSATRGSGPSHRGPASASSGGIGARGPACTSGTVSTPGVAVRRPRARLRARA